MRKIDCIISFLSLLSMQHVFGMLLDCYVPHRMTLMLVTVDRLRGPGCYLGLLGTDVLREIAQYIKPFCVKISNMDEPSFNVRVSAIGNGSSDHLIWEKNLCSGVWVCVDQIVEDRISLPLHDIRISIRNDSQDFYYGSAIVRQDQLHRIMSIGVEQNDIRLIYRNNGKVIIPLRNLLKSRKPHK
jgi:hypothetical protein